MNRELILLKLILSAVATVVIPYLVARIYKRILKVKILLKQMDLFYIDMVENDPELPEFARQLMEEKYNRERPTALVLFFSMKPLDVFPLVPSSYYLWINQIRQGHYNCTLGERFPNLRTHK